jgi:ribose transport system ATP-binding protein
VLAVENITKKFPGVTALNNVSMELHPGKVNAILGENGAGKSTLMKILSGVYCDYEGQILYKNKPVHFSSIREAQACGIAIIHQELNLIPYLNIRENIFLGREIVNKWGLLDKEAMRSKTRSLLQRLKLDVDPDTQVSHLKIGQQQVVEIAKALLTDADVIIMDEPTSAISDHEVEVLFGIIEDLKRENKTIVYISHKLDELFRIADRFIVLRDGCSIESGDMKGMDQDSLVQKMVGRQISVIRKHSDDQSPKEELLRIEKLCLRHAERHGNILKDVSFTLGKGEILGIFGLMGAGRTELMEALFGSYPKRVTGDIYVEGKPLRCSSPSHAIKAGLALVPEDRKKDGLVLGMDVRTNICLTTLEDLETGGLLNHGKECGLAEKYIEELKIKTPSDKQAVKNLSGGNQQKIVLAKWLAKNPRILMLDEPTRGIDINAKNEIYNIILQLAEAGIGIIVVSSELPEILAISDRILVLSEGRLTAEIPVGSATENTILKAAIPKTI